MKIFSLVIVLIILFILVGVFVKRRSIKIRRIKKEFSVSNEKSIMESIFHKNFLFFEHLNNTFKEKLLTDSYVLSKLINIDGVGIQITDEIKYTIFGLVGLLILGDENPDYFPNLTSVVVYPKMYISDQRGQNKSVNLGESWNFGVVVLSWCDVINGTQNFSDGHNVALHEFAHQLDQQSGQADGIPVNLNNDYYTWKNTFDKEYNNLLREMENAEHDSIDFYGATNKAEFFAVCTETFFEKSAVMKSEHPELYDLLVRYYRIDPMKIFSN
ncbi:M90 family metallopeptidase [Sebaldella sp. S0638]|uniref:M90 family metallopeptidase n=1 Tax=Sebaldella sp. S0638 TaxID=2957809 RepID=UPI00209CF1F0|nr:M90 family metallopeptidase [Sebaldella sp. S0638]MCP1225583.1 M90 family metallopeptidase [Sebaldella sp. S0638]